MTLTIEEYRDRNLAEIREAQTEYDQICEEVASLIAKSNSLQEIIRCLSAMAKTR